MLQEGLSRLERITVSSQIQKIRREGVALAAYPFRVFSLKNHLGVARMTVIVSKRSGNSVLRNFVKRTVREFFRKNKASLCGVDFVFYTAVPFKSKKPTDLARGLTTFLKKAESL